MAWGKSSVDWRRGQLNSLRGFCHVAQLGSMTKAAELVELSQPSISLQIQALEREFKVTLFQRKGPRITLTPEGQALYKLAWPLIEALDGLPAAFQAGRQGLETGWLNVAAGESTILHVLPTPVRLFAQHHPGIEIKLHNVTGRDGLKMLRGDAVDFAVGPLADMADDLLYEPLVTYDPMLIMPLDHPLCKLARVRIQDVAQYPLILPPPHLTTWRAVEYVFQKHRLSYRVAIEAGGWEVIKCYVEEGLGVSIVSGICLTGRERLATRPFHRYFPRRTYGIVQHRGRPLGPHAQELVGLVREQVGQPRGPKARLEDERPGH